MRGSLFAALGLVVLLGGCGRTLAATQSAQVTSPSESGTPARSVRPASAAGTYYPADPVDLYDRVKKMMGSAPKAGCRGVRAVLVPHGGYAYSGHVAAASFREVETDFRRVFLLAANHNSQVNLEGVSLPAHTHYAIPSTEIPLSPVVNDLLSHPLFSSEPDTHSHHMIEASLPFLYSLRGRPPHPGFTIVPMILGRMDATAIAQLSRLLADYADPQTLFVFSVDLSHSRRYDEARKLDMNTIQSIMSLDPEALARAETDGNQVLFTMVELAMSNGWEPSFLKYQNSGDVTGDRNRVVGYGSIVFHEPFALSPEERRGLLAMARSAIAASLDGRSPDGPDRAFLESHPILRIPKGVFVTLEKQGRLRGCIGELIPRGSLHEAVRRCAVKSATEDPRFPPVAPRELNTVTISISVLAFPRRIRIDTPASLPRALRPGEDGIILVYKGRQSTFLPKVWEDIPSPVDFLSRLCVKQGSPTDCWRRTGIVLYRYGAYDFGEETIP